MKDVFEVPQGLTVSKDLATERPAVYSLLFNDVAPEAFRDPGDGLLVFGEQVVDDLVGRGRLGPELTEQTHEGALA